MPNPSPRVEAFRQWGPAITVVLALISALIVTGGVIDQVKTSSADIATMKARMDRSDQERAQQRFEDRDKLNTIDVRTARIEATLQSISTSRGGGQ
ncbi:hypothetical protein BH10PSE14_BH10PSE14_06920 [soil metagenome]